MHKTTGQSVKTTQDWQPNTPTPDNIAHPRIVYP